MNKSKNNYMKGKKGITLIALVVTIIILIILAGISINLVLGENGIIQKAKETKVAQTEAEAKEKIEMILAEYAIEREFNNKTLLTFLEEKKANNEIEQVKDNEDGTYTIEVDGYALTINVQKLSITEVGKAGVRPIVSNIKITTDGTTEVTDKVVTGTPLTINFEHSINEGTTTVDKTLPYITNGTETEVTFVVTGTVNGENYTKTIFVSLADKYRTPQMTIGDVKITNTSGETVADNGALTGTPLKINFDNSIEEGTIVIKLGEETVTLPYTTNGTDTEFKFVVIGTVNGIDYDKEVNVSLANKYRVPEMTVGDVVITNTSNAEVLDKGVIEGTPLKINFANSIEGGTTVVKLGGTTVTLPYTTNGKDTEFKFVVIGTVNGIDYDEEVNVSLASKYRKQLLSEVVKVGDYVNYNLGNWTQQDKNKVGTLYQATSKPTTYGKFGGFGVGTSKDSSITVISNNRNSGWRVLSKNSDGTIKIIHAGLPEAYYNSYGKAADSQTILQKTRDWSMYEDCSTDSVTTEYAVPGSAHCLTYDEIHSINASNTLKNVRRTLLACN